MKTDWLNILILAGVFLGLFGISEYLHIRLKLNSEVTRKIVHIFTGIFTFLFPVLLTSHWSVLILCSSFALILIISIKNNWLHSINKIDRKSVGSFAYPVSVYTCYLVYDAKENNLLYFYLPILILAFCDPVAAFAGKKWPRGKYKVGNGTKTLMGTGAFIILALFLTLVTNLVFTAELSILQIAVIAVTSAIAEAISRTGFDNLTIPLTVLSVLLIFNS